MLASVPIGSTGPSDGAIKNTARVADKLGRASRVVFWNLIVSVRDVDRPLFSGVVQESNTKNQT
jgi:hypothetical protein